MRFVRFAIPTNEGPPQRAAHVIPAGGAEGADRFPLEIAFGRITDPLRPRAEKAFEEFFFSRARDVYPTYDFARMNDDEYGASLALDQIKS